MVFLNGYQADCTGSSFAGTFGSADQVLQANGEAVVFFDNCSVSGKPVIENLAVAFGTFLAGLKYDDGQAVTTVDVVAHSMGGLIVRSYLSGQQSSGAFQPPATVAIRKAVFLATPHFGTPVASLLGNDSQTKEMASGASYLFNLATWNQGTDDLRGVDAIAAVGNAGTSPLSTTGFDDGVVPLTSASLGFALPGRTRVLPFCHVLATGAIALVCPAGTQGIAQIQNATDPQAKLIVSFLNGTTDWQSVGTAPADNTFLSKDGGLLVQARTKDDVQLTPTSVKAALTSGSTVDLMVSGYAVAYNDKITSGQLGLSAVAGATTLTGNFNLPSGVYSTAVLKPGPNIAIVIPAASKTLPLAVAPGEFVTIWGSTLADSTAMSASTIYPTQLADAQVLVNGTAALLTYVSPQQINAIVPAGATGPVKLTVQNTAGSHTVNVWVQPAVPSIFTQDGTSTGPASAQNASNKYSLVTAANPLHVRDYVALYLTGLGVTQREGDGLDWAVQQPTVTIGGQSATVTYAGRAPGYDGLDQINCIVPAGLGTNAAVTVTVTSGQRSSNIATLAVQ